MKLNLKIILKMAFIKIDENVIEKNIFKNVIKKIDFKFYKNI